MSANTVLPPLFDRLTSEICSYLDAASLGRLATASKPFHLLAPSVDSSAGKIQKLIQKYEGRDGGLDLVCELRSEESGIRDSSHNAWVFGGLTSNYEDITLLAQGKNFFSTHLSFKDRAFVGRSERHLFLRNQSLRMEVRNLQGELRCTTPDVSLDMSCFELDYEPNLLRLVQVSQTARVSVWEAKDNEAPKKIIEHNLYQLEPHYIKTSVRFGDLLVLISPKATRSLNVWSYNLKDLQKPPEKIKHPHHDFFSIFDDGEKFCSNSNQLFFLGSNNRSVVAYIVKNNTLKLHWEKSNRFGMTFVCASDRYLLVKTGGGSTSGQNDFGLEVFDTQTGGRQGEFTCSFIQKDLDRYPKFAFQIWRNDILVVQNNHGWHFWELPHGRRLHAIELENCSPVKTHANSIELALFFQDKSNNHIRLLDLSMTQLMPTLPKLILSPPVNIFSTASAMRKDILEYQARKSQPPPPPPPTLFEEICSYLSSVINWLADACSWLWKKLF